MRHCHIAYNQIKLQGMNVFYMCMYELTHIKNVSNGGKNAFTLFVIHDMYIKVNIYSCYLFIS